MSIINIDQLYNDMQKNEADRIKFLNDLEAQVAALKTELNYQSDNIDGEIDSLVNLLNSNKDKF